LSSIEHFGGLDGAVRALAQMHRVLKPGGIAAITTECIVNEMPEFTAPGLELFTTDAIRELSQGVSGLELVEPIDFSISSMTKCKTTSLSKAIQDSQRGHSDYPLIVMELQGRHWTCVFHAKVATDSTAKLPLIPRQTCH
jgi:hypothetical protein